MLVVREWAACLEDDVESLQAIAQVLQLTWPGGNKVTRGAATEVCQALCALSIQQLIR